MNGEAGARRPGRPALTDRSALLAAARTLGFAGLTVGVVTAAVGVKYSTFYRHFTSLDALVTALVDEVCEQELVLPDADQVWQDQLCGICRVWAQLLERYPGMAAAVVSLPDRSAQVVSLYRRLTEVLLEAGFDAEQATLGAACALETVTITEMTTPGVGRSLAERQHRLEAAEPPVDPGVLAVTSGLADEPISAWTARKIALLVRGLEADLAASTPVGT